VLRCGVSQFGGLWIRRYRRYQNLKQSSHHDEPLSFSMVPLREDGSTRTAAENEELAEKVLEQSGLKTTLASIQRDMSMVRRASAHQAPPPKHRLISTAVMRTFNRLESRISHSLEGVTHKNEARPAHHSRAAPTWGGRRRSTDTANGTPATAMERVVEGEDPSVAFLAAGPSSSGVKESTVLIPAARPTGSLDGTCDTDRARGSPGVTASGERNKTFLPPLLGAGGSAAAMETFPSEHVPREEETSAPHPFGA
jgi:hypothetical protein